MISYEMELNFSTSSQIVYCIFFPFLEIDVFLVIERLLALIHDPMRDRRVESKRRCIHAIGRREVGSHEEFASLNQRRLNRTLARSSA